MSYKTSILINFEVFGIHRWPKAAETLPEVGFLSHPHTHRFHFSIKKGVETGDNERQIEIIAFEREIQDYFKRNFWNDAYKCVDFRSNSCEVISLDLAEAFDLDMVSCTEDGYSGAIVEKEK